jgi:hypothetical protein
MPVISPHDPFPRLAGRSRHMVFDNDKYIIPEIDRFVKYWVECFVTNLSLLPAFSGSLFVKASKTG